MIRPAERRDVTIDENSFRHCNRLLPARAVAIRGSLLSLLPPDRDQSSSFQLVSSSAALD